LFRFQELDLSAQCFLQNESNREDMWVEALEKTLRKIGVYTKVRTWLPLLPASLGH